MDVTKYGVGYYPAPKSEYRWVHKDHIDKAPAWCSVDLRDGNQSLIVPMSLEEKLEFFGLLVKIGFKEIEVGFPPPAKLEYEFLRTLIEQDLIPRTSPCRCLPSAGTTSSARPSRPCRARPAP